MKKTTKKTTKKKPLHADAGGVATQTLMPSHPEGTTPEQAFCCDFVRLQADLPAIPCEAVGQVQARKYRYATLPSILSLVRPVLARHGFGLRQGITGGSGDIGVTTRLVHFMGHEATESVSVPVWQAAQRVADQVVLNPDMQKIASQTTYLRRYGVCAILGIAADPDDDGAAVSGNGHAKEVSVQMPPASDIPVALLQKVWTVAKKNGFTADQVKQAIKAKFGKDSSKDVTESEARQLLHALENAATDSVVSDTQKS